MSGLCSFPVKAEILDHVLRPDLPWRKADAVECGRSVGDVKAYITRDELRARFKRDGRTRTVMTVCVTCLQTANRWKTFDEDPVDAMRREVYGRLAEEQLSSELRALGALATAYREDFDAYIAGLNQTTSLADRRIKRRQA